MTRWRKMYLFADTRHTTPFPALFLLHGPCLLPPPKISDIAKRLICVVKHNLWLFWHWLSGIIIVISYTDVSILTIVWSSDKNDKIIDIFLQNLGQYCVWNMMRLMQGHRWCRPFLCRQGQFACYDSTPGARLCSTWLHIHNFLDTQVSLAPTPANP